MTTIAIRKKLVDYMKVANEKKVMAMYALLEDDIKHGERISIEQYNKELEEAEAGFEKGEYITHEAMLKKMEGSKK
jgi:hypothetical protein